MRQFIEVTTMENNTVLLNVNLIFSVEDYEDGSIIKMAANTYSNNREQFYLYIVKEDYKKVKNRIIVALS